MPVVTLPGQWIICIPSYWEDMRDPDGTQLINVVTHMLIDLTEIDDAQTQVVIYAVATIPHKLSQWRRALSTIGGYQRYRRDRATRRVSQYQAAVAEGWVDLIRAYSIPTPITPKALTRFLLEAAE